MKHQQFYQIQRFDEDSLLNKDNYKILLKNDQRMIELTIH
jgi:hypothetical protein